MVSADASVPWVLVAVLTGIILAMTLSSVPGKSTECYKANGTSGVAITAPGVRKVILNPGQLPVDVNYEDIPDGSTYIVGPAYISNDLVIGDDEYGCKALYHNGTRRATFCDGLVSLGSVPPTAEQIAAGGTYLLGDPVSRMDSGWISTAETKHSDGSSTRSVYSVYDNSLRGVQMQGLGGAPITRAGGKLYVGDVPQQTVRDNPHWDVYVGEGISVSEHVQLNFSCLPVDKIGCKEGDPKHLDVMRVNDPSDSLSNGAAGNFYDVGAFDHNTCYKATDFTDRLERHVKSGTLDGYFKTPGENTCQPSSNQALLHVFDSLSKCQSDSSDKTTVILGLGEALSSGGDEGAYLLRCWCTSPDINSRCTDSLYPIQS